MQDTDGDERVEYEVRSLSIRAFDARPVNSVENDTVEKLACDLFEHFMFAAVFLGTNKEELDIVHRWERAFRDRFDALGVECYGFRI